MRQYARFLSILTGFVLSSVCALVWAAPQSSWPSATPEAVGLNVSALKALDLDILAGHYALIDSLDVFRCGRQVFSAQYPHDYGLIYGQQSLVRGPLNQRLTGRYNYFDPATHPYWHGSDLHSMQSITKTVTSITIGIAINRGDFRASLDTPVLHWFNQAKVRNVDERKRRMTLRHVLTMTTGLDWDEDVPYADPRSDSSRMEATDDWVAYTIDKPMALEPGSAFKYSSGATQLLAYIFRQETGKDIEAYASLYLFTPLGIRFHWKRAYDGTVDTEGGLFLNGSDLAKLGQLYLDGGRWKQQRIVSEAWVHQSVTPAIAAGDGFSYGFKWWLYEQPEHRGMVWLGLGFGGQELMVFPGSGLIASFTGWELLNDSASVADLVARLAQTLTGASCAGLSSTDAR